MEHGLTVSKTNMSRDLYLCVVGEKRGEERRENRGKEREENEEKRKEKRGRKGKRGWRRIQPEEREKWRRRYLYEMKPPCWAYPGELNVLVVLSTDCPFLGTKQLHPRVCEISTVLWFWPCAGKNLGSIFWQGDFCVTYCSNCDCCGSKVIR